MRILFRIVIRDSLYGNLIDLITTGNYTVFYYLFVRKVVRHVYAMYFIRSMSCVEGLLVNSLRVQMQMYDRCSFSVLFDKR